MLSRKKELAILLALGCGWTLGGLSSGGGQIPLRRTSLPVARQMSK